MRDQIERAVAYLKEQDQPNISEAARLFSVDRSTLSKRFNGVTNSRSYKHENQQILTKAQEGELVKYIQNLTACGLPPTPAMVHTFVHDISGRYPGKSWMGRFLSRWKNDLESRYLRPFDVARQKADNYDEYKAYFDLIEQKIEQYSVQPANIYNMDEKGFLIGFLSKAKRVFTKAAVQQKKLVGNVQDGSREWVTTVACICADGGWIPPALIYKASTGNIQESWVQDFGHEEAFFASSPNGWTDNQLGLAWLTQVFDRYTKAKAGRAWRLLFVDGHGSHINMAFLQYCSDNRILVAVYPPHSTHRLQPLDVALFSPLAIYYSQELDVFIRDCQGLSSITKRDFFRLFWPAFIKAFSVDNVCSAWRRTGIHPFDPSEVLRPLEPQAVATASRPCSQGSSTSILSASDLRKVRALFKDVVQEVYDEDSRKKAVILQNTLHALQTQNALLKVQNDSFKTALINEKKKRKRGKALFEEVRSQDNQGSTFFSPQKIMTAKQLQVQKEAEAVAVAASKAAQKEASKAALLAKQHELEQRRLERKKQSEVRAEEARSKAAEKRALQETKAAAVQLQTTLLQSAKKTKARPKQTKQSAVVAIPAAPAVALEEPVSLSEPVLVSQRSGRALRRPKHLEQYHLDS
jgi:hypothetical protein